jgi:hypothetical protein
MAGKHRVLQELIIGMKHSRLCHGTATRSTLSETAATPHATGTLHTGSKLISPQKIIWLRQ